MTPAGLGEAWAGDSEGWDESGCPALTPEGPGAPLGEGFVAHNQSGIATCQLSSPPGRALLCALWWDLPDTWLACFMGGVQNRAQESLL